MQLFQVLYATNIIWPQQKRANCLVLQNAHDNNISRRRAIVDDRQLDRAIFLQLVFEKDEGVGGEGQGKHFTSTLSNCFLRPLAFIFFSVQDE